MRVAVGPQQVELHVDDAGGVVGALQEGAELQEVVGLVAQQGDLCGAEDHHRLLLHRFDQRTAIERAAVDAQAPVELEPQRVQALPHIDRDVVALFAGVAPGRADRAHDRGGVVLVDHQEVDQAGQPAARLLLGLAELVLHAEDRGDASRFLAARLQRHALGRLDEPRRRLGALQVASHPIEVLGGAAQHVRSLPPQLRWGGIAVIRRRRGHGLLSRRP